MPDTQPTATIADELKTLKGLAAALAILTESQGRDDTFYVALELSLGLNALSERYDRDLQDAKPISNKQV